MDRNQERFLFSLLLALQAFYILFLLSQGLIPAGHDGFQYFTLQYYFLNNSAMTGEIPQWMPFMTQGTVASWWYVIQSGFVQSVATGLGVLGKGLNFIYTYYAGIYFDELVLLLGCWLLSRRFLMRPLSSFVFCASVMAGCLPFTQAWYNLHLYYCMPLLLYFFHRWVDTGRPVYVLGACNLFFVQCMGNLPYFFPVLSFAVCVYAAFFAIFNAALVKQALMRTQWKRRWVAAFLVNGAILYCVYMVTAFGTDLIVNYNKGRSAAGLTDLAGFLNYGGSLTMPKWWELLMGVSQEVDYSVYGGVIMAPLFVCALVFAVRRGHVHLVATLAVLLDFGMGGITAKAAYYCWPLMKYYRHIALIVPLLKVFVFLIASVGYDHLLKEEGGPVSRRQSLMVISFGSLLAATAFLLYFGAPGMMQQSLNFMAEHFREIYINDFGKRLAVVFLCCVTGCILCGWWAVSNQRGRQLILILLAALHMIDCYSYKMHEAFLRTAPLDGQAGVFAFQPVPFVPQRLKGFIWENDTRAAVLMSRPLPAMYWSNDSFIFKDYVNPGGFMFRTDHWLRPLDLFMRTYWGQDIHNVGVQPKGLTQSRRLFFPLEFPSAAKMSGVDQPKIQVFAEALRVPTVDAAWEMMRSQEYAGDIPVVLDETSGKGPAAAQMSANARLEVPYVVDAFSSNHLKLSVDLQQRDAAWLYYSDVWHPGWRAEVNGKAVPVYQANLAYKAVEIQKGINHVHFYFFWPHIQYAQWILAVFSLMWICFVVGRSYKICR